MSDETEQNTPAPEALPPLSATEIETLIYEAKAQQNIVFGLVAGVIASLVGAGIWTAVTVATNYHISYVAIGVGFLVGFAIRFAGKGVEPLYGYIGAVLALFGVVMGNVLTGCYFIGQEWGVPFSDVVAELNLGLAIEILKAMFQPMDLLFYGIAIFVGYQYSFTPIDNLRDSIPMEPDPH